MNSKKALLAIAASTLLATAAAEAAGIDMNDPRRAVGREDDVRVDAQLTRETVSPGAPVSVTYQIQNFTSETVAVADKISDASYDEDERTITLAIGSEVPTDGNLPHLVTIAPGERKVLRASAIPQLGAQANRSVGGIPPRYVRVRVTILRDLKPFVALIQNQAQSRVLQRLPDELFDRWMESSDTILLNAVPVGFTPRDNNSGMDASQRAGRGF
jgi:hypothetical protein